MRVRTAKAQAVVGDYPVPGGLRQLRWEVAPQRHTPQRIMQQDNGRPLCLQRRPILGEQLALRGVDPVLAHVQVAHTASATGPFNSTWLPSGSKQYSESPSPSAP
ncbi:hypothetical protein D3C79_925680 [compost metagenome]